MKNQDCTWEGRLRNSFPITICGAGTCMELTKAVCALLAREPNRSWEEAVEDVCRIYQYIQQLTGLSA